MTFRMTPCCELPRSNTTNFDTVLAFHPYGSCPSVAQRPESYGGGDVRTFARNEAEMLANAKVAIGPLAFLANIMSAAFM